MGKHSKPRTFKSEDSYNRYMEGHRKGASIGGKSPKHYTPETINKLKENGYKHIDNLNWRQAQIIAEKKEEYKT